MILKEEVAVDLATPTGPMRTYMFRPAAKGKYPAVVLFSEIFQATGPIRRFAAFIAGHGYIVAVPEVYHELEPAGTVLAYDQAGSDKGNADKYGKPVSSYDSDARALLDYLKGLEDCTGRLGAIGICMGGHLAFRAAMNPDVLATVCFYATDIHSHSLGLGKQDDSLGARRGNQGRAAAHLGTSGSACSARRPQPDQGAAGRGGREFPVAGSERRARIHARRGLPL